MMTTMKTVATEDQTFFSHVLQFVSNHMELLLGKFIVRFLRKKSCSSHKKSLNIFNCNVPQSMNSLDNSFFTPLQG